ncbi:MAG: HupE/UreJ family protein, partial [Myxococcota bacterium]
AVALGYLKLGVEHILTGWDHLVFLAGLLLVTRSLRAIAAVVTGFTVAHSITLTLAALGWVSVPSSLVEPAIAASIAFVGIENGFDPPVNRRFALTAALGLIHGLGFAGALADVGLPAGQVPLALATFNLGVELGQFGVVLAALPLLLAARRASWGPAAVRVGSWAIAALGLYWFVDRTILTL